MAKESALEDGFYEVEIRIRDHPPELCYVETNHSGTFATFSNGQHMPILPGPSSSLPYIIQSRLTPTDPRKYFKQSQDMIRFIFTNLGRLARKEKARESPLAQSAQVEDDDPDQPGGREGGTATLHFG